jgi:thiol-disulfide isomerase/thioredoxin
MVYFSFHRGVPARESGLLEVNGVKIKGYFLALGILILSAMVTSGCSPFGSESGSAVEVGRPAPNFKLKDMDGHEVSLDQYKGRVVLLDFWATWCGPCRMTLPMFDRLQKEYASTLVLLAINLQDSKEEVKNFIYTQGFHSQVLLDESGSVGKTYGAASIPLEVLIDKEGIVRHVQMGFDPGSTMTKLRAEIEQLR